MIEPDSSITPTGELVNFTETEIKRFWSKVIKTDYCWQWTGAKGTSSGQFRHFQKDKNRPIGRVSWMIHNGEIPTGLFICHHCDNGCCVNPSHLFLGTPKDNMQDKVRKGRGNFATGDKHGSRTHPESVVRGERQPHSKLTDNDVRDIRKEYAAGGVFHKTIAAKYGVCRQLITTVIAGHKWKHVK